MTAYLWLTNNRPTRLRFFVQISNDLDNVIHLRKHFANKISFWRNRKWVAFVMPKDIRDLQICLAKESIKSMAWTPKFRVIQICSIS